MPTHTKKSLYFRSAVFAFVMVVCASVASAAATAEPAVEPEATAETPGPEAPVESLHAALISVMKNSDKLGYSGRFEELKPIVTAALDLDFMAQKATGSYWRKFSDEQKSRWVPAFSDHTIANYAGRFHGYSGQSFVTHGQEPATFGTVLVRTTLINPDGDDVQLNYRLRNSEGNWRIIDIYMQGTVSELALRRAEYSSALKRDGVDAVIAKIHIQTSELADTDSSGAKGAKG